MPRRATRGDASRTEVVTLRLTKAERTQLQQRAAAAGLTVSAYAAQALAGGRVTVETRPAALALPVELVAELKRIGNNVNQIAHALNSRKAVPGGALADEFSAFVKALLRDEVMRGRTLPFAVNLSQLPIARRHDSPAP